MDDDERLVMSPLCQNISRDGMTIEVHIYRGIGDDEWILEVVDEENASTVWDDMFPNDKAALNEVLRTIEKEGMTSFLRDPSSRLN